MVPNAATCAFSAAAPLPSLSSASDPIGYTTYCSCADAFGELSNNLKCPSRLTGQLGKQVKSNNKLRGDGNHRLVHLIEPHRQICFQKTRTVSRTSCLVGHCIVQWRRCSRICQTKCAPNTPGSPQVDQPVAHSQNASGNEKAEDTITSISSEGQSRRIYYGPPCSATQASAVLHRVLYRDKTR